MNWDKYRKVSDKSNESYIHDCQFATARLVVESLMRKVTRSNHVILVAPMQSGKTGICNGIVNIINVDNLCEPMGINKFFFITGMNDTGLKRQTVERVYSQIIDASQDNTYINLHSDNEHSKYFVLKNSDLIKFEGVVDNSIIFIDEAHYGSNDHNKLSQFIYNFDFDWKDKNELIKRNIYIVSISATPFDEIISDRSNVKNLIIHKPDTNYVGVTEYMQDGLIQCGKFDDKIGQIVECLIDAEDRMDEDGVSGVAFVRTREFQELREDEYVNAHFDIFEMASNGSKLEYIKLNQIITDLIERNNRYSSMGKSRFFSSRIEKPKPLLVMIKGAYRAGITIKSSFKDYIYMVYDYSMKAASTAQAMLGRMCGYRDDDVKLKTVFYINEKMANQYGEWESDFGRDNVPCDKFTTICLSNDEEEHENAFYGSRSCGNFAIPMDDDEIREFYQKVRNKRNRNEVVEKEIPRLFAKHDINIRYDYIMENAVSGKNHYKPSSQQKRFDSFTPDSLVYQFRPTKIKKFMADTGRTELEYSDVGKRCISVVLDAEIYDNGRTIGGNKRMLVYYVEVAQKIEVQDKNCMYKKHKDTSLV